MGWKVDKLQHEMYWNFPGNPDWMCLRGDKLQHEMYWNFQILQQGWGVNVINYNMRCIETTENEIGIYTGEKDKLQHEMYWNKKTEYYTRLHSSDKLQHEMYWNEKKYAPYMGYNR